MRKPWDLLTSPRHLAVFEAAARHGSFTRAADELNVQQPAVSATIKQLEATLGVDLFVRRHRKIELTAAGLRLFSDTSRAFEQLTLSAQSVRQLARSDYVTLNASSAFNNYWVMPHLARFQKSHTEIDLRLQTSDREPDIDVENISLAVRRGHGIWPGCTAELLAPEVIYPVAAPHIMSAAPNLHSVPGLLQRRLIHLEEPIRERPTWQQWFAHFGITKQTPQGGLRLNDYALVLQAAMAGEGIAFGWKHISDPLVEKRLLSARRDWAWKTGEGFYLVWSNTRPLGRDATLVRDWILDVAATIRAPSPT